MPYIAIQYHSLPSLAHTVQCILYTWRSVLSAPTKVLGCYVVWSIFLVSTGTVAKGEMTWLVIWVEHQKTRVQDGGLILEQCWTNSSQTWTRFMTCEKPSNSHVIKVALVAQFSTTWLQQHRSVNSLPGLSVNSAEQQRVARLISFSKNDKYP